MSSAGLADTARKRGSRLELKGEPEIDEMSAAAHSVLERRWMRIGDVEVEASHAEATRLNDGVGDRVPVDLRPRDRHAEELAVPLEDGDRMTHVRDGSGSMCAVGT